MSQQTDKNRSFQTKSIADHGAEASNRKKKTTRDDVIDAMRAMEREIERGNGIYPLAEDGKVSAQEVLRRAGKSSALLEKAHHKVKGGLKETVTDWVAAVNGKISGGVWTVRKMITERVDEADARLKAFKQAWVEAELEYVQAKDDLRLKDKEISALRREVERLELELAGSNVIRLRPADGETK